MSTNKRKKILALLVAIGTFSLLGFPGCFALCEAKDGSVAGYYWVDHQGRDIQVYGVRNPDGSITWNPELPVNARPRERRSKPNEEPVKTPTATVIPEWATKGVAQDRSTKAKDTYTAHSAEAARFVVEATSKADPEGKRHVTIIGNADERARVVDDIKTDKAFDGLRENLLVQDYEPGEWPVDPELKYGTGKPAIIVQESRGPNDPRGGRVIFRAMDYSIGPARLAEACRRPNKDRDPDKDPGPDKPLIPSLPSLPSLPNLAGMEVPYELAALAVVLLVFLLPSKKGG